MESTAIKNIKSELLNKKNYLKEAQENREYFVHERNLIRESQISLISQKDSAQLELESIVELRNNCINGEDLTKIDEDISILKITISKYTNRLNNLLELIKQKKFRIKECDDQIKYLENQCSILELQLHDLT